jgi:hypothetical protein
VKKRSGPAIRPGRVPCDGGCDRGAHAAGVGRQGSGRHAETPHPEVPPVAGANEMRQDDEPAVGGKGPTQHRQLRLQVVGFSALASICAW